MLTFWQVYERCKPLRAELTFRIDQLK